MKVPVILNVESVVRVVAAHPFPAKLDPAVAKHNAILHALGNLAADQRHSSGVDGSIKALDLLDYMLRVGYKFKTQWCLQHRSAGGHISSGPWNDGPIITPTSGTLGDEVLYLRVLPENVGPVPLAPPQFATTLTLADMVGDPHLSQQLRAVNPTSPEAVHLVTRARNHLYPVGLVDGQPYLQLPIGPGCSSCAFATPTTCNHPKEQPECLSSRNTQFHSL